MFTANGHAFIQTYSIKAAHPELPFGMHVLTMMASLSNGGSAHVFPRGGSPLLMFHLNVNYAFPEIVGALASLGESNPN